MKLTASRADTDRENNIKIYLVDSRGYYCVSRFDVINLNIFPSGSYTYKGLKAGTYYVKVAADGLTGVRSTEYSFKVEETILPPAAPTGLKGAAASKTSIKLDWDKVTGAKNYIIYQKVGSNYVNIATTSKNTYTVKSLKENTKYYFKIAVTTASGTSKQSAAVSVMTLK